MTGMIQAITAAIASAVMAGVSFLPFIPPEEADQYTPDEVGEDSDTWISVTTIDELESCYTSQGAEVPWHAYTDDTAELLAAGGMTCEIGASE